VSISITSKTGQLLRVIRNANAPAGRVLAFWDGRYPNKRVVFSGTYVAHVTATNSAGTAELNRSFRIRRR
jgi:flagellar hook assembly protein FlgD